MVTRSTPWWTSDTDTDTWIRRGGALAVAAVAAYASYVHQREFALQGGADTVSAGLWPLPVDGLLLLATMGLLKRSDGRSRQAHWAVSLTFLLGIAVSLAAKIAAASALAWKPVLVAGWPPIALLLSVELLAHRRSARTQVSTAVGRVRRVVTERSWMAMIHFWSVLGVWMCGIGSCISVRSRPSHCARSCGSVRSVRASSWLRCV
ncbi:DUF2637 domain-containing protein [Streptomyces sp. NPDC053474]|uniref:DUF2637 domain-containing protein n=1 Tax=Streptomyces sp. NPDC053474 TaxID=3365704 RepID=UPI0037D4B5D4